MYLGLHVKYPFFLLYLVIMEFSLHILEKYSNVKFREKSFEWKPIYSMRTDKDGRAGGLKDRWTGGRTGMTKLMVAFRNFAKEPNKHRENVFVGEPSNYRLQYRTSP